MVLLTHAEHSGKDMVELTMALFAWFRVNGDVSDIFTLEMIT